KDAWMGFRADIGQRALEPAQRLRQTSQAPEAQRPVLPCLRAAQGLVNRSKQATRGRRSRHTFRVATFKHICQPNVRELQTGVIAFASLHMEATHASQFYA